jgi:hypothetical protein
MDHFRAVLAVWGLIFILVFFLWFVFILYRKLNVVLDGTLGDFFIALGKLLNAAFILIYHLTSLLKGFISLAIAISFIAFDLLPPDEPSATPMTIVLLVYGLYWIYKIKETDGWAEFFGSGHEW